MIFRNSPAILIEYRLTASLDKDYNSIPWIIKKDSATQIIILDKQISLGKAITTKEYNDSISSVLLKWDKQKYFQNKFIGQNGLKTYYMIGNSDSMYIISDIVDSTLLYLLKHRGRDQYARVMGDIAEAGLYGGSSGRGGRGGELIQWVPVMELLHEALHGKQSEADI